MKPPTHTPAEELKVVLPFAGGTICLIVSDVVLSFEVLNGRGEHLHTFWLTDQEMHEGKPIPPE